MQNFGPSRSSRAVSIGIAALILIVIASIAGLGIYLSGSLKRTSNSIGISTTTSDSSATMLNTTGSYQYTSSSTQSLTYYSLHIPQLVFGINHTDVIPNETLTLPPNALLWETFTLNSTSSVSGINFEIIVPQTSLGSGNVSGAYYLNGDMVSHVTYPLVGQVPSSVSNNNQQPPITTQEFSIVVNSVFKVGSNVTVALTALSPVSLEIAIGNGNSFLMRNVTTFPESVPLQFNSSEPLFFAWGSYG